MTDTSASEAAKAVVRRNTEEVQGGGNFDLFEELFADDFLDHTPQPGRTPNKAGARELYKVLRRAFPDFRAEIHWQLADGNRVTTYKTYHGTHKGDLFGIAPTGRKVEFETVDVMRVRDGKIAEHWGWRTSSPLCSNLVLFPARRGLKARFKERRRDHRDHRSGQYRISQVSDPSSAMPGASQRVGTDDPPLCSAARRLARPSRRSRGRSSPS